MSTKKRITRTDLEVMFQQTHAKTSRTRSTKIARTATGSRRTCEADGTNGADCACAICLEDMTSDSSQTVLTCKHPFHKTCLESLQNPQCPLCRHPINEDVLDKSIIDAMEKKRQANIVEANAEAAAYYAALANRLDEKIPIGSEDWKLIVRYDLNLNLRLHDKLMMLTGNRHTSMAVENLITEMQCVYRLRIVRFDTDNRALFEWFLQKIQFTRISSEHMFNEAHLYFPEISYKTMKQYAFQALKLLYKKSL